MKLEEALKVKRIKVTVPTGRRIPRNEFLGDRVMISETIERDATLEDVLSFDEVAGVVVTCDGQRHYIFR